MSVLLGEEEQVEPYQDVEKIIVTWVLTVDGVMGAGSVTDSTLAGKMPFVRVNRVSGSDDGVTDRAVIDLDVFGPTRDSAWLIAERVRAALRPRIRVGTAIIDSVRTSVSPRQLPWDNNNIKRVSATYGVTLRR